jgi:hypothetical protein
MILISLSSAGVSVMDLFGGIELLNSPAATFRRYYQIRRATNDLVTNISGLRIRWKEVSFFLGDAAGEHLG